MFYLWLMIVILLLVAEMFKKNIVAIFYMVSGLISLILSLFIASYFIQVAIFVAVGTILLISTRTAIQPFMNKKVFKIKGNSN